MGPAWPLGLCAPGDNVAAVEALFIAGVLSAEDVSMFNPWGAAPLHLAASWGHPQFVRCLLARGAQVDIRKVPPNLRAGQIPLHCAALQGHVEVCEVLLTRRSDVGLCDANGAMALHYAVMQPVHVVGSR